MFMLFLILFLSFNGLFSRFGCLRLVIEFVFLVSLSFSRCFWFFCLLNACCLYSIVVVLLFCVCGCGPLWRYCPYRFESVLGVFVIVFYCVFIFQD